MKKLFSVVMAILIFGAFATSAFAYEPNAPQKCAVSVIGANNIVICMVKA